MWLPKDERRLLIYYYKELGQPVVRGNFFLSDLRKNLEKLSNSNNPVRIANKVLNKRNLINLMPDQGDAVTLSLTLAGYDLGRKYSHWWSRSNLWYKEHIKNHWIALVIAFVLGVVGTLLVNWLSQVLGAK